MLGGLFELERTGEHDLKGFARPVPAWRVRCEASVESRFSAIRAGRDLPLIGRAHEMGLILERWRLARQGEGQIVTVTGEAGIGKSRSIEALQEAIAAEPHTRINLQCSPYHSDSALYPVIQYLSRAAGFIATDPPDARIEKLGRLFASPATSAPETITLVAELLSIPVAAAEPAAPPSAQRKAATLALIADHFLRVGYARAGADRAGGRALDRRHHARTDDAADRRHRRSQALVVVTARPDFTPPWRAVRRRRC